MSSRGLTTAVVRGLQLNRLWLIDNLERAHKFAARSNQNNWCIPYEDLLDQLSWPSLAHRRHSLKLLQLYKFYHGHSAYSNRRFIHVSDSGRRVSERLTAPHHLVQPPLLKDTFTQSFEFSAIKAWNSLPYDVVVSSPDNFSKFVASIQF